MTDKTQTTKNGPACGAAVTLPECSIVTFDSNEERGDRGTPTVTSTLQSDALWPDITFCAPCLIGQRQESFRFETRFGLQLMTSVSFTSLVT